MNANFGRISENLFFSLLLAAVIGWTGAQLVEGAAAVSAPADDAAVATAHAVHRS